MPQDWTSGYGVYGFKNPYDAQVARAVSKATGISGEPVTGGVLNTDYLDPQVRRDLSDRAVEDYINGAGANLEMGGIYPSGMIRSAVNNLKPYHLGNVKQNFDTGKIRDMITSGIERLYERHPRVASTLKEIRRETIPEYKGSFANTVHGAEPETVREINAVSNGPAERVGIMRLNDAKFDSLSDAERTIIHEATHGAQYSIGGRSGAKYTRYNNQYGYALNPYEIGARATTNHEMARRVTGQKNVGSYAQRWANEANKVLGRHLTSNDPAQVVLGENFKDIALSDYSKRFFGDSGKRFRFDPQTNKVFIK